MNFFEKFLSDEFPECTDEILVIQFFSLLPYKFVEWRGSLNLFHERRLDTIGKRSLYFKKRNREIKKSSKLFQTLDL